MLAGVLSILRRGDLNAEWAWLHTSPLPFALAPVTVFVPK